MRISPLPNGDIYISFRRLNMIGLIDKQTRKMKWQHRDDSFGMQHDCEPLPNGNITLFANGTNIATNPFSRVIELDPHAVGVASANWTTGLLATYLAGRTGHRTSDEAVRLALHRADYVCKRSGWTLKRKAQEQPGWAGNG